jgi:hypothetical protein
VEYVAQMAMNVDDIHQNRNNASSTLFPSTSYVPSMSTVM